MSKKTKNFPEIQKLVSIEGEGIATISTITGKKGIQLTEAQLETIEAALSGSSALVEAEKQKATTAEGKVTAIETAITGAITTAGLTAADSPEENISLLGAKVVELGKKPGAKIGNPKSEGDKFEQGADEIVNASDSHNELYNKA
mgnify:CR=1 FL=1